LAKRDGRNQAPTAKRKRDARRKGQLPRSQDVAPAVSLLAAVAAGGVLVPNGLRRLSIEMTHVLENLGTGQQVPAAMLGEVARRIALAWFPVLVVGGAAAMAATVASQGGVVLGSEMAKPSLKSVSLKKGLMRLSPKQALPVLARSVAKFGALALAVNGPMRALWSATTAGRTLPETLGTAGRAARSFVWQAALLLCLVAAVDYLLARRRWRNDLKMTRQEVVDESKSSEGDPRMKAMRRRRAFDIMRRRTLPPLSMADVVVTNPTHFAVALAYVEGSAAPRVIAKGVNGAAARIRREAARHGVPLVENRPLARALYRQCRVGAYIPQQLFDDVVSVLVTAYWRRGRFPSFLSGKAA
jgi:flagellar biosynthetic protein FlhB